MHHPTSLRSKRVRFAMIPTALLCAALSGCTDQQPAGPAISSAEGISNVRVAQIENVPFNKFFIAWSQKYSSSPIETQTFALDSRQDRQYGWWPDQTVLPFASANPGRLYINGDEPDQYCVAPDDYAIIYHNFVTGVRAVDPTARFSPAGFAEPNGRCCPAEGPCRTKMHSTGYADQFYNAYVKRYGTAPRVNEWRFHDFGLPFAVGDLNGWWARVDSLAAWSVAHGANMVLGGWGFHGWREPVAAHQEHMKQAIGRLMSDRRILGAVYWSYEPWVESPRPLANDDGSLTPEGQTYANPLTDIPNTLKILASANGHAKLRWSNTTSAWGAETEFWVQARGSNSFVYKKTEMVSAAGALQTPFVALNAGDSVKARVRYYNVYGKAAWSPFSNTVLMASSESEATPRGLSRKNPVFCFLQLC